MDPGSNTPNRTPAAGTVAEPFRDRPALAGTFLDPPQSPDELGRLAHYRILTELGRGGMGVVYRGEDTVLQRPVAVKAMLPGGADAARARARFRREAEAQAKVDHLHVAPIYSVGEANGVAFLVMPLLRGTSLAAALKLTPKPPLTSAVRIGREIAEGLAAAHDLGLIHRDIKPGNIWLEAPKWRVKILDFGLARVSGEGSAAQPGQPLTATGAIMGTPAYMSPEQARTQPTDYRSDLFSLGVVLYQMTTGVLPFVGASVFDVLTATVSHHPPPAHEVNPAVPLALSELIWRLMAKNPSDRPASAAAVAGHLIAIGYALSDAALQAVPHPARVEPDAWSALDTAADTPTGTEIRSDATRTDERLPAPRRSRRRVSAWAIATTGVAVALGLAWAVAAAIQPKLVVPATVRPQPADEPPLPKVPPAPKKVEPHGPDFAAEREAAEKLVRFANLAVATPDGRRVVVPAGGKLPDGKFAVAVIDFANIPDERFKESFVADTFLPAVARLGGLERVQDGWALRLSLDHLRQMAGAPLARTLRALEMSVELTPEALTEVARFAVLTDVALLAHRPTDDLFARLAGLTHLRQLTLSRVPPGADALTDKGWAVVAGMPLERFTMWGSRGTADALKAFAARRGPLPALRFMLSDVTDKALNDHLKPDTELREIEIHTALGVTNNGLAALANVKALRVLTLNQTTVSLNRVTNVFENRRDLRINYNGLVLEQKK